MMIKVKQKFNSEHIDNVAAAVRKELDRPEIGEIIRAKGKRVAIGVGSRGINRIDEIVAAVVSCLKEKGAEPFIVPAMGSHGGATPSGQRQVLEALGITEESAGVPIEDTMETVRVGTILGDIAVYLSKPAAEADWLLPINRIKPHTDFEGPIQSGTIKLLGIGFGKQTGCMSLHEYGTENFGTLLPALGKFYEESNRVGFALGIVENAYDKVMLIRAIEGSRLIEEEESLYKISKENMARLFLKEIDVLIVEQFGKEISGAGMDTNITGRTSTGPKKDYVGPVIKRIVVSRLSERTHGNACAISCADIITKHLLDQIDFEMTYTNSLCCYNPPGSKIPIVAKDEAAAIDMAVRSLPRTTKETAKIVRILDTAHLDEFWISENMLDQVEMNPNIFVSSDE